MLGFNAFSQNAIADIQSGVNVTVSVTGVQGTTALGTVAIILAPNVSVTGVQGTTALGTVTVTADANVSVTGVSATGELGVVLVWSVIPTPSTSLASNSRRTNTSLEYYYHLTNS